MICFVFFICRANEKLKTENSELKEKLERERLYKSGTDPLNLLSLLMLTRNLKGTEEGKESKTEGEKEVKKE